MQEADCKNTGELMMAEIQIGFSKGEKVEGEGVGGKAG